MRAWAWPVRYQDMYNHQMKSHNYEDGLDRLVEVSTNLLYSFLNLRGLIAEAWREASGDGDAEAPHPPATRCEATGKSQSVKGAVAQS